MFTTVYGLRLWFTGLHLRLLKSYILHAHLSCLCVIPKHSKIIKNIIFTYMVYLNVHAKDP